MKKWAFDPKNSEKRVEWMMMSHHTIFNGQKQPRLVPNMSWNDSKLYQKISQIAYKW